jgi:coenzyme A diphosphatase NUDT7
MPNWLIGSHSYGIVKQAAVLVALYEQPGEGKLRVLLTTRAKTLR